MIPWMVVESPQQIFGCKLLAHECTGLYIHSQVTVNLNCVAVSHSLVCTYWRVFKGLSATTFPTDRMKMRLLRRMHFTVLFLFFYSHPSSSEFAGEAPDVPHETVVQRDLAPPSGFLSTFTYDSNFTLDPITYNPSGTMSYGCSSTWRH